jgi:long-chain acyl-CoA synthetase
VVRIAADGEVQVRGSGVLIPTLGENASRAASINEDGFLATGDLGSLDEEGFLTLVGRTSEVFKNSQGRWVSLPEIEAALRRVPGVEHAAVVVVNERQMIGVLALTRYDRVDACRVEPGKSLSERLDGVRRDLPSAMKPIGFVVLRDGFSVATGELTTNLKLRRDAIHQRVASAPAVLSAIVRQSRAGEPNAFPIQYL